MNRNKLLLLGLLASIAINLAFVGGISFRFSNLQSEFSGRPLPPNVGWIVRDLSEERRTELSQLLQQSFEVTRPIRAEMLNAQRLVNELMAAQSFDSDALEQAFADLRDANLRYQALSHQQTGMILSELSEQERQTAMEFVQRRGPRDGRDGFRGREGGREFGPRGFPGPTGSGRPPPPEEPGR